MKKQIIKQKKEMGKKKENYNTAKYVQRNIIPHKFIPDRFSTKRIVPIVISLILVLFIISCRPGDEAYSVASEQYAIGWLVRNVDDNTPTTLSFNINDLAIYNYSYNYPEKSPQYYKNGLFYLSPATFIGAAWLNDLTTPLDRVYYLMGKSYQDIYYENYNDWSYKNSMSINYLIDQDPEKQANYEFYINEIYGDSQFSFIRPIPQDKKSITFGTAPFKPTSVKIENNVLQLKDKLVKGYSGDSYLSRMTYLENNGVVGIDLPSPTYELYLNNLLVSDGAITSNIDFVGYKQKEWEHTVLFHVLSGDGEYKLNITIPTLYPVWSIIQIDSKFIKPNNNNDLEPPQLNSIFIMPRFEQDKPLPIAIDMSDTSGIQSITAEYSTDGLPWQALSIVNSISNSGANSNINAQSQSLQNIYGASILPIANDNLINLRFTATDNNNNEVTYTILNASLLEREVNLNFQSNRAVAAKGDSITFSGGCIDSLTESCGGLRLEYLLNGKPYSLGRTEYNLIGSFLNRGGGGGSSGGGTGDGARRLVGGRFSIDYSIPPDYNGTTINMTVFFKGTGVYSERSESAIVAIATLDNDIALSNLATDLSEVNVPGTINATLTNVGNNIMSNTRVTLEIDGNDVDSRLVPNLNIGDSQEISFIWTPNIEGKARIEMIASNNLDSNINNNLLFVEADIGLLSPIINTLLNITDLILNKDNKINITLQNLGNSVATDLNIRLYESRLSANNQRAQNIIGTENLAILPPGDTRAIEFTWTPNIKGDVELLSEITYRSGSSVLSFNQSVQEFVSLNGTDLKVGFDISNIYGLTVNTTNIIVASVTNKGLNRSANISLDLFDNGIKVGNTTLPPLDPDQKATHTFQWIPTSIGQHTLRVVADTISEEDPIDNSLSLLVNVGSKINSTISIKDSNGNFISRELVVGFTRVSHTGEITLSLNNVKQPFEIAALGNPARDPSQSENPTQSLQDQISVVYDGSIPLSQMNAISERVVVDRTENRLYFYEIYANNISWEYDNMTFYYLKNMPQADKRGIILLSCNNFNFSSKKCIDSISNWREESFNRNNESGFISLYSSVDSAAVNNVQAFAVVEPDYDEDNVPDSIDTDDDNDNIIDIEDGLKCIQGRFDTNIAGLKLQVDSSDNLHRRISGKKVARFVHGARDTFTVVEFAYNFTPSDPFDCDKVTIQRETIDNKGTILVNGIVLKGSDTKTVLFTEADRLIDHICIKDAEVNSISAISQNCNGLNEILIRCDGNNVGSYSCVEANRLITARGLRNSALTQMIPPSQNNNLTIGQPANNTTGSNVTNVTSPPNATLGNGTTGGNASNITQPPPRQPGIGSRGRCLDFGKVRTDPKTIDATLNDKIKFNDDDKNYALVITGLTSNALSYKITDNCESTKAILSSSIIVDGFDELDLDKDDENDILVGLKELKNRIAIIEMTKLITATDLKTKSSKGQTDTRSDNVPIKPSKKDKNESIVRSVNTGIVDKEDDKSSFGGLGLFAILAATAGLVYYYIRGLKPKQKKKESHHEVLDMFVKGLMDKEYSNDDIRHILYKKGWVPKDINDSLRRQQNHRAYTRIDSLITFIENSLAKGYKKEQIARTLLKRGWSADMIRAAFKGERGIHKFIKYK